MQNTEIFSVVKIENFVRKKNHIFDIFAHNIDCGYTLERHETVLINEYPQSILWIKITKCILRTAYPNFVI